MGLFYTKMFKEQEETLEKHLCEEENTAVNHYLKYMVGDILRNKNDVSVIMRHVLSMAEFLKNQETVIEISGKEKMGLYKRMGKLHSEITDPKKGKPVAILSDDQRETLSNLNELSGVDPTDDYIGIVSRLLLDHSDRISKEQLINQLINLLSFTSKLNADYKERMAQIDEAYRLINSIPVN